MDYALNFDLSDQPEPRIAANRGNWKAAFSRMGCLLTSTPFDPGKLEYGYGYTPDLGCKLQAAICAGTGVAVAWLDRSGNEYSDDEQ